ncbi:helix-hairpin-helix domain-containing protein [Tenacibaculum sp. IB213877]|uniref:ComEA family DNA-binding protein n=1 Tax=Tenacibaculum sp. IB213877 TaxID=3097351 RepID=UPI002A5A4FE1|nr:helix-hairpin-helix domain-containing protein [Tenacibaculum sp. IB213877]MDY0781049.1 helix-hairpin-helix domain-containing protein [Tenacibaculum sp. IB213877]
MKTLKSHFRYTKSQRNGILFLVILIILFQCVYAFVDFSSEERVDTNKYEITSFLNEIDSLKVVEIEKRKPKIYPFNPNYITDFKGYQLGMSVEEIDRLLIYRKQNKWINSASDFQQVTKVSDSLLAKLSSYFKFPDWVVKRNKQKNKSNKSTSSFQKEYSKKEISTNDINLATSEDFKTIYGIGDKLSERIIKYRTKLQGFTYENQVNEVWGLEANIVDKLLNIFKIQNKPIIKKVNVNTASFKEVLKNPYINYELCKKIFDYRDEVAELQNIDELKNIDGFPVEKYDRIVLYLEAK